jgi:hypothetical protein
MSRQQVQIHAVNDSVADRNVYWDRATDLVGKMLGSDHASEIMADFLTKLAFSSTDADPLQLLGTCCGAWDYTITEDDDEFEYADIDD